MQNVPTPIQRQIQNQLNSILNWKSAEEAPFMKSTPLHRNNESKIVDTLQYFVCERCAGARYLLLLVTNGCYLINMAYEFKYVPLFCPIRPDRVAKSGDKNQIMVHNWTLLDGVLVDKESEKTFVLYDALMYNGQSVMTMSLQNRLKLMQNDIIAPRKNTPLPKGHPVEMFQLGLQAMYPSHRVSHVTKNILAKANKSSTGLMFIPIAVPYGPGQSDALLEWKYPANNTVVFQIGTEWRGRPQTPRYKLIVKDKRSSAFYDWLALTDEMMEQFKQDKKIASKCIECIYDPAWPTYIPSQNKSSWEPGASEYNHAEKGVGWRNGGWKVVAFRTDVRYPIDKSQIAAVEASITKSIAMHEFSTLFPDDPAKAQAQAKLRKAASDMESTKRIAEQEANLSSKRRKAATNSPTNLGVCYDFQNKGSCHRGETCHFSHCACDTSCTCTKESNTFGQLPQVNRADLDAPANLTTTTSSEGTSLSSPDPSSVQPILLQLATSSYETRKSTLNRIFNDRVWANLHLPPLHDENLFEPKGYNISVQGILQPRP